MELIELVALGLALIASVFFSYQFLSKKRGRDLWGGFPSVTKVIAVSVALTIGLLSVIATLLIERQQLEVVEWLQVSLAGTVLIVGIAMIISRLITR